MPKEQQDVYDQQAKASWLGKQEAMNDANDAASVASSSAISKQRVEQAFFGLGSLSWPQAPGYQHIECWSFLLASLK